jgi:methylmalonyl-CoA mutase C-terminal domain/subunit
VIYTGLHQSPEQIVSAAIQEDVDLIGLSSLAAAHLYLFPKVMDLLKAQGADDIMVIGGGIIPEKDIVRLEAMGVQEIFPSGTSLDTIIDWINQQVKPR